MAEPKKNAYDGKAAAAGDQAPEPERNTIDALGDNTGITPPPGEPVRTKSLLEERDENRWELDPDSSQR